MAFMWLSEDTIAEPLTKTERKESNHTQNILLDEIYLIYFFKSICKKTLRFYPETVQKIGQSLEDSLRRGKFVKNFKIF